MSHGEVCCKSGTIITRALADLLLAYVAQAFLLFHGQRDTDAEVKYNIIVMVCTQARFWVPC